LLTLGDDTRLTAFEGVGLIVSRRSVTCFMDVDRGV